MDIDEDQRGENPFDEPVRKLRGMDPRALAEKAVARWEEADGGAGLLVVPVLSSSIGVRFPGIEVEAEAPVGSFSLKLLTLLYLSGTDGTAPSGDWVAYRELAGARFYEPVVKRSVEDPVALRYARDEEAFREACASAGGEPEDLADAAYSFYLFPLVRVAFLLWRADEEFAARARVLFDSNSTHHLNAFDLRMGSAEIASRLLKWKAGEGA